MVFLDTETKHRDKGGEKHHTTEIAVCNYVTRSKAGKIGTDTWSDFDSGLQLCSYLDTMCSKENPLYVFGHNIYFDLQAAGFFRYFPAWGWSLKFIYDKGLTYILSIRQGARRMKLLSTTNFFDSSLKELGHNIGLEKLDINFDATTPEYTAIYCKRDVEIVRKSMLDYMDFLQVNALGRFALTRASQSLTTYRTRFMTVKIAIHGRSDIIDLERFCYMGARTEAFRIGKPRGSGYAMYDINSMYPSVMREYDLPVRCVGYRTDVTPERLGELAEHHLVCADVDLRTTEPAYACRFGGKLIFPIGHVRTGLCTGGIRYASQRGHITKVHGWLSMKGLICLTITLITSTI